MSDSTEPKKELTPVAQDDDEDDGFVVVGAPLPSVKDFADWIRSQRMPSVKTIVSGKCEGDEMNFLIDRKSFLRDALKSFETLAARNAKLATGPQKPPAPADATKQQQQKHKSPLVGIDVDDGVWAEIWTQFKRDLPRQQFVLQDDNTSAPPPTTADDDEDYADAAPPKTTTTETALHNRSPDEVVSALRDFLARHSERLPPVPANAERTSSLFNLYGLFRSSSTSPTPVENGAKNHQNPHLEHVLHLIILMSQQGVLALPLEMFNQEFCIGAENSSFCNVETPEGDFGDVAQASTIMKARGSDGGGMVQLFVGEIPSEHEDEIPNRSMRIKLFVAKPPATSSGSAPTKPRVFLEIVKPLRVFTLLDMQDDYSLFFIDSRIVVDVFGQSEDPIEVKWSTTVAKRPLAVSEARAQQQKAARARESEELLAKERIASGVKIPSAAANASRRCDCLGASAGYHKRDCPLAGRSTAQ